jgi:dipeptidyl aminopeptidase/acylaminoacyl peptidase
MRAAIAGLAASVGVVLLSLLLISCGGDDLGVVTTGTLSVTAVTTGFTGLAPDYELTVDGDGGHALAANGTITVTDLAEGNHDLELGDVPSGCTVDGPNPRVVAVVAGETARVTFEITCSTPVLPGSLEITTTTGGQEPDPDGYLLSVDGGAGKPLPPNGVTAIPDVTAGNHSVQVTGIADNCVLQGINPMSVVVTSGQVTPVTIEVTCSVLPVLQDVILFSSDRSSTFPLFHIFRMNADGSEVVDLTPTADGEEGRISPSGRKIAFTSHRDGSADIFLMNADGAGVRKLTTSPAHDSDPAWSPDETKLVYVSTASGTSNVWVMNADGSGATQLTSSGGFDPSWSPGGSLIAYSRAVRFCNFDVCAADIFVIPASGGAATDLTNNADEVAFEPAWSPDGSHIAFEQDRQIWIMQADGSDIRRISRDGTVQDLAPVWSPDGSAIAFKRLLNGSQVFVMNADGSAATNLSESSSNDAPTSWR